MPLLVTRGAALAELVQRYQVCWEVWPEYSAAANGVRQIGFELELLGSDSGGNEPDPCSAESAAIHAALRAIARWILEREDKVRLRVDESSQSLCYSPVRRNRADVTLSITILHRTASEEPADEEENKSLERTKSRLRELVAFEHQWHVQSAPNGRRLPVT
jgi:hypothetical protein